MHNKDQITYIFCILSFFLCGATIFIMGFFPASYSSIETENAEYEERPKYLEDIRLKPPTIKQSQFILMIIDGMRYDFGNYHMMPFTHNNECEKLKISVDVPTVTLPRIKSITTGKISSFIDIAFNVGQVDHLDDSILHRLKAENKISTFIGDRVWIKLFPQHFKRNFSNDNSFYVNDFYNGDGNATAHLVSELNKTDWTFLVIHYLGLDHIGHVEGAASKKIAGKLKEMDEVIEQISKHENFPKYFLIVTGDHGMADEGGHGGNSPGETSVPLYILTANCTKTVKKRDTKNRVFNQIDMTPTLAILMSIQIPKESIGCLIPELLNSLSMEDQLYAYYYNAHHLIIRASVKFGKKYVLKTNYYEWYTNAQLLHKNFLTQLRKVEVVSHVQFERAKQNYERVAREISKLLSESLVKFDYGFIVIGLALTTASTLHALLCLCYVDIREILHLNYFKTLQILVCVVFGIVLNIFCHYMRYVSTASFLNMCLLILPIGASIYLSLDVLYVVLKLAVPENGQHWKLSITMPYELIFIYLAYMSTMSSTSYIDEERLTCYFLANTLLIYLTYQNFRKCFMKYFNSNQKKPSQDLHTIMLHTINAVWELRKSFVILIFLTCMRYIFEGYKARTTLLSIGLFVLWARLRKFNTRTQQFICLCVCVLIYCFRGLRKQVYFFISDRHLSARLIFPTLGLYWCLILTLFVIGYKRALSPNRTKLNDIPHPTRLMLLQTNLTCSLLIAALLQKPHYVILLPLLLIVLCDTYKQCDKYCASQASGMRFIRLVHLYKIVLTIFIGRTFYYHQGNSNSLTTVDLNPGYIGQSSYNPAIVGLFVTLNTFSAEINAFLYLVVHTLQLEQDAFLTSLGSHMSAYSNCGIVQALVMPIYVVMRLLPVAYYFYLLVSFRYHLFIYSVFSPKVFYDCYSILVLYLLFLITSLCIKLVKQKI